MKELSIEEKAKCYDEALKYAMIYYKNGNEDMKTMMKTCFPVLVEESEDEKIRKELVDFIYDKTDTYELREKSNSWLAWLEKQGESNETKAKMFLINKGYPVDANGKFPTYEEMYDIIKEGLEKQGEQKPADKVEPKFQAGYWIIDNNIKTPFLITDTSNGKYDVISIYGHDFMFSFREAEPFYHIWTIQDAKDGDVLAIDPWSDYPSSFVVIYKKQNEEDFDSYCFVGFDGKFYKGENGHSTEDIHPATKEQRELLFQNMKEAGYEWDADKKELKKIEHKPAWSEEDEMMIKFTLTHFRKTGATEDSDIIKWLKSLKDRVQPKQEWSEEEKENVDIIVSRLEVDIEYWESRSKRRVDKDKRVIGWLKSLKGRYTWKLSDEQIEILDMVLSNESMDDNVARILRDIREQLKKLKE